MHLHPRKERKRGKTREISPRLGRSALHSTCFLEYKHLKAFAEALRNMTNSKERVISDTGKVLNMVFLLFLSPPFTVALAESRQAWMESSLLEQAFLLERFSLQSQAGPGRVHSPVCNSIRLIQYCF